MVFDLVTQPGRRHSARIWAIGALISVGSATYILYVAAEEPFFHSSTWSLVTLEGFGLILLLSLWFWTKAAVTAVRRGAPSKHGASVAAFAFAWALVCTCYLVSSMAGCLYDFQRYRAVPGTLGSVETTRDPK